MKYYQFTVVNFDHGHILFAVMSTKVEMMTVKLPESINCLKCYLYFKDNRQRSVQYFENNLHRNGKTCENTVKLEGKIDL